MSEVLALVVQQSFDLKRIEQDANEMKLVNEIADIFRESGGQRAQRTIERAIELFSDHTGFACAQVSVSVKKNQYSYRKFPRKSIRRAFPCPTSATRSCRFSKVEN